MKLYLKNKPKNLEDLLVKMLCGYDQYIHFTGAITYFDKECTKVQCRMGKLRSWDDLFIVAKTYFSRVTEKGLMSKLILTPIKEGGRNSFPQFASCHTMRRIRIHYARQTNLHTMFDQPKYNSIRSWNELFALLGIKNTKDYTDYLEKNRK